jgi:hypothetical protein
LRRTSDRWSFFDRVKSFHGASVAAVDSTSEYGLWVDEDTGLWIVTPEFERGITGSERRTLMIVHLNCIASSAVHLLPVFGSSFVPEELHFSSFLDVNRSYFVNNNVGHHRHESLS